jgi:hypothetical protein
MMQCWRCNAKRRVNQAKDASKRCELKLDLEPLALPPDLPPVILKEFGWGGLFEKVGVVREMSCVSGLSWLWAWSVETMDCLLLLGGGAVL